MFHDFCGAWTTRRILLTVDGDDEGDGGCGGGHDDNNLGFQHVMRMGKKVSSLTCFVMFFDGGGGGGVGDNDGGSGEDYSDYHVYYIVKRVQSVFIEMSWYYILS